MVKGQVKENSTEVFTYICVILSVVAINYFILGLGDCNFAIPFSYKGDGIVKSMLIKGIIDNGWFLHNPLVGAPAGLDMHDYPMTSNLDLLMIKLVTFFIKDHIVVFNLYYIFTFPLIACAAYCVTRALKFSRMICFTTSILYACMPYHYYRSVNHLFLANYFSVPLITWIAVCLYRRVPLFYRTDGKSDELKFSLGGSKAVYSVIVCIIAASSAVYYAFFSCFIILAAGVASFFKWGKSSHLVSCFVILGLMVSFSLINLSPHIYYSIQHGGRNESFFRNPVHSEMFGFKISQLLLPADRYRIDRIAELKAKFNTYSLLINENRSSTLGSIGGCGFLFLLLWLIHRVSSSKPCFFKPRKDLLSLLSILNISAVLLGTIGGFGSLFAYLVSSNIRCYNRISIFIAFFSLLALSAIADCIFFRKSANFTPAKAMVFSFFAMVLIFGLWDQTTPGNRLEQQYKAEFNNDASFIAKIEAKMPENAMIFQLPYSFFPEPLPEWQMENYDHFKAYLHSKKRLRWSYGAIKGRKGDDWQRNVSQKGPEEFLSTLSFAGFSGIFINLNGYENKGDSPRKQLEARTGEAPMIDDMDKYAFYDLTEFNKRLKGKHTNIQWQQLRKQALYPLQP